MKHLLLAFAATFAFGSAFAQSPEPLPAEQAATPVQQGDESQFLVEESSLQPVLDPATGEPVIDPATGQPVMQTPDGVRVAKVSPTVSPGVLAAAAGGLIVVAVAAGGGSSSSKKDPPSSP
ncbi:hypothetical protein [Novilysobacter antarcticus]|uniref:hypothetical protein n=1 Tax=Novilysobacter antarcticus TaxID=2862543 RepID=UPI001C98F58D|nr:hypothetical protein [Lysobacter antarcticus]